MEEPHGEGTPTLPALRKCLCPAALLARHKLFEMAARLSPPMLHAKQNRTPPPIQGHHPCKRSGVDSWYLQSRNGMLGVSGEALWELPVTLIPSTKLACHFIRSLSKSESLIVLLPGESNSYNNIASGKSSQAQCIMLKQSITTVLGLAVCSEKKTVFLHRRSWRAKENFNYLVLQHQMIQYQREYLHYLWHQNL